MTPNRFADFQDWKGMDGADAWLIINRHADGWADTREMMEAWRDANAAPSPPSEVAQQADDYLDALDTLWKQCGYSNTEPLYKLFQGFVDRVMPLPPPPEDRADGTN